MAQTQTLYGAIELSADNQFTLSAPVEATVAALLRPAGSPVARGQGVVSLRASPSTQATYAQNAAAARSAQQAYERAKRLRADGLVSDAEVESARSAAAGASAQARALSAQTGGLVLRSPGAGYVQSIVVNPGDLVAAGATVATIARAGDLRARFGLDPALVSQLVRGKGVRIARPGGGEAAIVPILSVDPSADPQTLLASLYASVPAGLGIGAGQTMTGEVTLAEASNAVTIPYSALLDEGGQPYVYVVTKGVAHRRDVVAGASDGPTVAIAKGVAVGDVVVTQGGTALEDGMKVRTK
ncbi:efflux RND transporter periplasmic adaptor subunit [Tsuneonella sp. YG55]|uniref:Efflux RND transporter periplasmic adaptor subunit n=1 Tax=Tsuneonella litorea TaxID=2976475 RepID=A0A9X2W532_9SPHN|nr:efflux RND transporter periplasmic adaptor subunit [Tsuneonella litorea]MCT2560200.1 efflux RND transporter periplasmic adaptor subunit [Tsuneonella litorea]